MTQEQLTEQPKNENWCERVRPQREIEVISNNDFLDDLYNKTFFDTRIIDELEDYLIQNKITIITIK